MMQLLSRMNLFELLLCIFLLYLYTNPMPPILLYKFENYEIVCKFTIFFSSSVCLKTINLKVLVIIIIIPGICACVCVCTLNVDVI